MSNWTIPSFVLSWLKENIDGYQFLSPAAKRLRDEMEKNKLESDEDFRLFGDYYDQFLSMIEINPLTMTNREGSSAEILANDFYFFFFPTRQDVYLPIGLYIEIGAVNPQDAQNLRDRMMQAYSEWIREQESSKQQKIEEVASLSEENDLKMLMKKTPSRVKYIVSQALVLILAFLCIAGDFYLYNLYNIDNDYINESLQSLRSFETPLNLTGIVFIAVLIVSIFYVLLSLVWIVHEGKRERFIDAWKNITLDMQEKRSRIDDFRDPDRLKRTIDRIGSQNFGKGKNYSGRINFSAAGQEKKNQIEIEDFNKPKNRSLFQTARPVHVFAMLMIALCLFVLAGDNNPGPLKKLYAFAKPEAQNAALFLNNTVKGESAKSAVLKQVDLQLVQAKKTKGYHSIGDIADDKESVTFKKSAPLSVLFCDENGEDIFYYVKGKEKGTGKEKSAFVKFDKEIHHLEAKDQFTINNNFFIRSWKDENGAEKDNMGSLDVLFDGDPTTAANLQKGDIIGIDFSQEVELCGMYILTGNAGADTDESNGVSQIKLNKLYDLKNDNDLGYAADLTNMQTDNLEIEITGTTDKSDTCSISEIIFVGPETAEG